MIITTDAQRNGEYSRFLYESGAPLPYPEFNDRKDVLSLWPNPGWPLQTSISLEFPICSRDEVFEVRRD